MGSKKSKQSLARRNVSSGSVYGSAGPESDNAKRGSTTGQAVTAKTITTATTATTEDAARIEVQAEARRVDSEETVAKPQPREFEARPCTICVGIRPHGKNYSRVYTTRGRVRYCKCGFCGNTWAQEG